MHVVAGRGLNITVLEVVGSKDRKFSKGMNINQVIIVFLLETEGCFSKFVSFNIPNKVIIDTTAAIFKTKIVFV